MTATPAEGLLHVGRPHSLAGQDFNQRTDCIPQRAGAGRVVGALTVLLPVNGCVRAFGDECVRVSMCISCVSQ